MLQHSYTLLALAGEIAGCIAWSKHVSATPAIRKTIKATSLFWAQFLAHPLIVAAAIYVAGRTQNPLWALALAPFVFNLGVEPGSLPFDSLLFSTFFYAHHAAPLFACVEAAATCGGDATAAIARALVYCFAWQAHPIWQVPNKERLFWPYMIEGAVVLANFGHVVAATPIAFAPVLMQFVGRWGLYLCTKHKFDLKPGHKYYDAFDDAKQPYEIAAVLGSMAVAYLASQKYKVNQDAYALLPLVLEVAGFIAWAKYVRQRPPLRKKLKDNAFFWTQFWLHPVIVFSFIYASAATRDPRWALALAPFVFSFGVEPWDLPEDLVFWTYFYMHHVAPLLACVEAATSGVDAAGALARALLFGHVWLLHPVGRLSMKQSLFWPYMVEGFAVLAYFGHVATAVAFLPVAVQFVGRWGLYLFVTHKSKFNIVPGHPYYDAFEDRKQPIELAAVLGGVAVACLA